MKLIHLSDLHLGKRLNDYSMIADQQYILNQILKLIDQQSPEGVMIAGDIYDKGIATHEALLMFDDFLVQLAQRKLPVLIISGNHDSPERMAFGSRLMIPSMIYVSPVFDGKLMQVTLHDQYGPVNFHLLPFLKPSQIRKYFPDLVIDGYDDAVRAIINQHAIDHSQRNVLITHQFVTGATISESEELSIGGSDNVNGSLFDAYDYVALGHLHRPQTVQRPTMRYCGSPLKYSFSEVDSKTLTVVTLQTKGEISIELLPLVPLRDLRTIKGTYEELTYRPNYINTKVDDYIQVILNDEHDVVDAISRLQAIYPNIMKMAYANRLNLVSSFNHPRLITKSPLETLQDFYESQRGQLLTLEQTDYLNQLIEGIWEEQQ